MKTVGELKEFLKGLDDNMPLVSTSDNPELKDSVIFGANAAVSKFRVETRQFIDTFDYTAYLEKVCVNDENGVECLWIG